MVVDVSGQRQPTTTVRPPLAASLAVPRIEFLLMKIFRFGLIAFSLVLAGCAGGELHKGEPSFYANLAQPGAKVDAAAAASMISGYRGNNGLGAVALDPQLMQLAEAQAALMAKRDKLDHGAGKPFVNRLKASGYDAKVAAENIGAGYHTLAEAFSGWRDSPPHRTNMLLGGATRMGIAAVYTPSSKYKVYWALILAAPDDRPS